MEKTRAKFRCTSVTDYGNNYKEVKLSAQYDESIPEDQRFAKASPSGDMTIMITNPAAASLFKPNQTYYLDISVAEPVVEAAN